MNKTFLTVLTAAAAFTLSACGGEETVDTPDTTDSAAAVETTVPETVEPEVVAAKVDHAEWDLMLKQYVTDDGHVDYEGMMNDGGLDTYLATLAANHPDDSWSREESMAYWCNAYNAFTVKLITENYPVASIMDLDEGKVWERVWIKLGENEYSLNAIEHEILRPVYQDCRVHFAVNCASYSCPRLHNEAFTGENLETNLEMLAKGFVNDPIRNTIDPAAPQLSQIFSWFADDFTKDSDLITWLNKYSDTPINADATLAYQEYGWALNE